MTKTDEGRCCGAVRVEPPCVRGSRVVLRALLAVSALAASLPSVSQILAVLEHPACKEGHPRAVRMLFRREGGQWRSVERDDETVGGPAKWYLASDPSIVVETAVPPPKPAEDGLYQRDFLLRPHELSALPLATNRGARFAGWCEAPPHRPQALLSQAAVPVASRAATPTRGERGRLLNAVRRHYGKGPWCHYGKRDDTTQKPLQFRDADLRVLQRVDVGAGKQLVAVTLAREPFGCGSEITEPRLPMWFVVGDGIRWVGGSMTWVEPIQLPGDAGPQYLFWYSGYNRDGYRIFSSDLESSAEFTWSYH